MIINISREAGIASNGHNNYYMYMRDDNRTICGCHEVVVILKSGCDIRLYTFAEDLTISDVTLDNPELYVIVEKRYCNIAKVGDDEIFEIVNNAYDATIK